MSDEPLISKVSNEWGNGTVGFTERDLLQSLYGTTNAQVWAEEWCKIARRIQGEGGEVIDEGWMIGWFANAIETGRNHA